MLDIRIHMTFNLVTIVKKDASFFSALFGALGGLNLSHCRGWKSSPVILTVHHNARIDGCIDDIYFCQIVESKPLLFGDAQIVICPGPISGQ